MKWLNGHVDTLLERWATGELSPRQASRLLRHARTCTRCGQRYERMALAWRVLEGGNLHAPSEQEAAAISAAGLEAALSAAAPEASRLRWPVLALLGGMLAALSLPLMLAPTGSGEWTSRGSGTPAEATLRVFCAVKQRPLRALQPGWSCPPGALLAFAAGAQPPLSQVVVRVHGSGLDRTEGPFAVGGKPGAEGPLEVTLPLDMPPGPAEIVAVFADGPEAARKALRGEEVPGSVVLRQQVRVEEER
jgi:hypothetical protein